MHIDRVRVLAIANRWNETDAVLLDAARRIGDASGPWAPALRSAVETFTGAWRDDLGRLATQATLVAYGVHNATAQYGVTDETIADDMKKVARASV